MTFDGSDKGVPLPQIRVTKLAQQQEEEAPQQQVGSRVRLRSNDDLKAKITNYLREKRVKEQ